MSRTFTGTVEVRDGVAVCVKPDGQTLTVGGKVATFEVPFGGLHPRDAGKRIYKFPFGFQMENDEQRDSRLRSVKT